MDEEEKPFPIEFIVILILVALANDIAEIFFDILDFTGVGVAGEAIMVPIDLVLDFFFTGIFVWKVGFGGGTITQYIDDLLEPFLIPGRTISVGLGMWIANNPTSAIGKAANTAAALESGNVEGELNKIEDTTEKMQDAAGAEKKIQDEGVSGTNDGEGEQKTAKGRNSNAGSDESESPESSSTEGEKQKTPEGDVFKNPYENPVGTAEEELDMPPEEEFQEGKFKSPLKDSDDADYKLPNAA